MSIRFRELIQPGTNFEFVGRNKLWLTLSAIAVFVSLAMLPVNYFLRGSPLNFSIDFKGGTDIVMTFGKPIDAGTVRKSVEAAGFTNVEVSTFKFRTADNKMQDAYMVRIPEFGALSTVEATKVADDLLKEMGGPQATVIKAAWSGDTLYVRSTKPLSEADLKAFLDKHGIAMKAWSPDQQKAFSAPIVGTSEYNAQVSVYGLDRKVQTSLAKTLGTEVTIKQVDAVGPKAGEELRNDAIKSMLYAIAIIMLYVALRFDFRYGPGTVASLLHDAILTIGVFAVCWVEFSLTTVAAVLTVIGYSMNDTIVVFDRIRENEHKLKDKKFDRVINISINETLSRTILTSLATFVTTLAMNLLGTGLVSNFAFAMNIGIIVGTYSSIFVAAPVLLWLNERYFTKRALEKRTPGRRPERPEPDPA
jgi:preprotein translocase subunit SecF